MGVLSRYEVTLERSLTTAERDERQFADATLEPGTHEHAVVLAPVKEWPGSIAANRTAGVPAVLGSRSTRRRRKCAGRDGKMLAPEPKDYLKEEDRMRSDQIS
jgi:hypothetical protein